MGPTVEAWNLREDAIDTAVGSNNYAAAIEMTRYLIGQGYGNIVMVGGRLRTMTRAMPMPMDSSLTRSAFSTG